MEPPNVIDRVNIRRCYLCYKLLKNKNDHDINIPPTKTKVVWLLLWWNRIPNIDMSSAELYGSWMYDTFKELLW